MLSAIYYPQKKPSFTRRLLVCKLRTNYLVVVVVVAGAVGTTVVVVVAAGAVGATVVVVVAAGVVVAVSVPLLQAVNRRAVMLSTTKLRNNFFISFWLKINRAVYRPLAKDYNNYAGKIQDKELLFKANSVTISMQLRINLRI